jgi:hypothetical protein
MGDYQMPTPPLRLFLMFFECNTPLIDELRSTRLVESSRIQAPNTGREVTDPSSGVIFRMWTAFSRFWEVLYWSCLRSHQVLVCPYGGHRVRLQLFILSEYKAVTSEDRMCLDA